MFVIFSCVSLSAPPVGAHPNLWSRYESATDTAKGTFTCFNEKKTIPISKINDGYPDCTDGSDEPGTSTFINGTFYCQNKGYMPMILQKWSVGDGICDCCDGSDEQFNSHVNCPNTCNEKEQERKEILKKLSDIISDGIKTREKREAEGKKKLHDAKTKKSQIKSQISQLEDDKKRVETTKPLSTPTPQPTFKPLSKEEENQKKKTEMTNTLKELKTKIEALKVQEGEGNHDATQELIQLKKDFRKIRADLKALRAEMSKKGEDAGIEDDPSLELDEEDQIQEEQASIGEPPAAEDQKEQAQEESLPTSEQEDGQYYDDYDYEEDTTQLEPEQVKPKDETSKDELHSNQESQEEKKETEPVWKKVIRAIWKFTFRVPDVKSTLEEKARKKMLDELSDKIRKLKDQLRDIEDISDIDDKTDPAYISIYKKSFKQGDFELEVLHKIKQSYTSLGNYKKTENGIQKFEGGQHCWQTQCGRKTDLETVCWNKDMLVSVIETDQCVHRAVFATPSACQQKDLTALQNMTVDELRAIATKVNYKHL